MRPPDVTDRGFAGGVDRTFSFYFGRYAPAGAEAKDWLTESAFVRRRLRNEVVEIYREQRTSAGQVAWLIRFMARQVRDLYEAGGDWKYMERFRVEWRTRAVCIAALTWALGSLAVSAAAIGTQLVAGVAMTLLPAVAGVAGSLRWVQIGCEFKRQRDEQRVHDEARRKRATERDRWVAKLEATRPSKSEMSAGFVNALHILEGIAAEGKAWMDRDPVLSGERGLGWDQSA